ncbi:MAG: hypothetical protein U9N59_07065 [Campylobacterota bacterium]|nr:hypothetical protein [Campylobacterota bacterium]
MTGNKKIVKLLLGQGADVNIKDNKSKNAIFDGSKEIINTLLEIKNIDLTAVDTNGNTILHDKLVLNDNELAKALILKGADSTMPDKKGFNFIVNKPLLREQGNEMLNFSIEQGCNLDSTTNKSNSVLMEVLLSFSNISKQESNRRNELLDVAKKLLKNGSNIDLIDKNGETIIFNMIIKEMSKASPL